MKLFTRLATAGVMLLALCGPAAPTALYAQGSTNQQPTNDDGLSTRWAMAYGLVGLGVVLGLLNVCRPGKRKGDMPKPG